MFARRTALLPAALAVVLSSTGCRFFRPVDPNKPRAESTPKESTASATQPTSATQASRPVPRGSISDANIAAMVLASNNTDISYARLVPSRAQREDVKKFADRMLTDHTGVNALVTQLLTKLDLAPEDNAVSLDMRDESANKRDLMRELSGFTFDSTYMENEVAYHQKFLSSIDNQMLPSARNADLRALLSAVRPAVAAHLAHAEQVRADVLAKK
jgi:putative membrane protein